LPSARFAARVVEVYSKDFGRYVWPKIIVADARDGMEYPMITLDNGTYPGHQQLLAHEIGHMWFYGMVGNNETYRAMLDEGFTQFLTVWAMDSIVGPSRTRTHKRKWVTKHLANEQTLNDRLYYPYLRTVNDDRDESLNTHSHHFNGAIRHGGSYGLVYFKTGVMLHNLRLVLGDKLFMDCMKHYFEKWKFCHPYPEDFRNAVTEKAQTDLNWFFDQWLETTKTIDYGVKNLKSQATDSGFVTRVKLKRYGRMQMPLEVTLSGKSGKKYNYHIPNTWFVKSLDANTQVLPKWYGWDLLKPSYVMSVRTPEKIIKAEIDTSLVLADVDRTNNIFSKRLPLRGTVLKFDHRVPNTERWDKPVAFWRPDVWYNGVDGVQLGMVLKGEYFRNIYEYEISAWGNTGLGKRNEQLSILQERLFIENNNMDARNVMSYDLRFKKKMNRLGRFTHAKVVSWMNAGVHFNQLGFEKRFQTQDNRNPNYYLLTFDANSIYRFDRRYALYPYNHSFNQFNNFSELSFTRFYAHHSLGRGQMQGKLRTPFWGSGFNYSFFQLEEKHFYGYKKLDFSIRFMGRYGIASGMMPMESALYLSGGNPEEMLQNKYYRAMGIAEYDINYQGGIYHFSGGLNVRGFDNGLNLSGSGLSGMATNIELEFDKIFNVRARKWSSPFHFDFYGFADIGSLAWQPSGTEIVGMLPAVASTGLGSVLTINFRPYNIKPLKIRTDFPLLVSHSSSGNIWQPMFLLGFDKLF
ncbi:MAG: M1 family aminopeptidase, partial [Cytophagales bacterium]